MIVVRKAQFKRKFATYRYLQYFYTCIEQWFSTENIFTFTLFSKFSVFKPSSGNNNRQEYSIDILVINDFTYQNETFELVFVCEKNIPQKV